LRFECPIPHCETKCRDRNSLAAHLWFKHRKNEIIAALLNLYVGEVVELTK